jgi:hypothetical protein
MHTHLRAIATRLGLIVGVAALLSGCAGENGDSMARPAPEPVTTETPQAVEDMLAAHGDAAWDELSAVVYSTDVDFAGIPYQSQTRLEIDAWMITERVSEPAEFTMRQGGGLVEVPEGTPPPGFNVEAMINRWAYFFAAPFVMDEEGTGLTYLGPVLIDGRLYDAVRVDPDLGNSTCPMEWLVAYITSPGNEVGVGHLAMLRYPVVAPMQDDDMVTGEHVAVYEPLAAYDTPAGQLVVPETITFHPWIGEFGIDGAEGEPNFEETLGVAQYELMDTE